MTADAGFDLAESFVILSWDSEQFGMPVARIASDVREEQVGTVIQKLRDRGVGIAYWFRDSPLTKALLNVEADLRLVDEKVTYVRATSDASIAPTPSTSRRSMGLPVGSSDPVAPPAVSARSTRIFAPVPGTPGTE